MQSPNPCRLTSVGPQQAAALVLEACSRCIGVGPPVGVGCTVCCGSRGESLEAGGALKRGCGGWGLPQAEGRGGKGGEVIEM